jgi:hypothetical protein
VSNRHARSLWAMVPAAVLTAVFGVTTALAATTWTVRPGGPVSMTSGTFSPRDTRTGLVITYSSARQTGTLKHGSGLPGAGVGSIKTAVVNACDPGGPIAFKVTAADLPWTVNFSSYNATNGVVTGSVRRIKIKLAGEGAPGCTAVIGGTSATATDGTATFTYTNRTAALKLLTTGGNLHFYGVNNCIGLIQNDDPATLSATFTVSPKQAITSP